MSRIKVVYEIHEKFLYCTNFEFESIYVLSRVKAQKDTHEYYRRQ